MPENEGGHPRVAAAEELDAVVDQPARHAHGHRLKTGGVGHPPTQRARTEPRVGGFHARFQASQLGKAFGLDQLVEATMSAVVKLLLGIEGLGLFSDTRIVDGLGGLAHRLDEEGLKVRHRQRCAVDHGTEFGVVGFPDGLDVVGKDEINASRYRQWRSVFSHGGSPLAGRRCFARSHFRSAPCPCAGYGSGSGSAPVRCAPSRIDRPPAATPGHAPRSRTDDWR